MKFATLTLLAAIAVSSAAMAQEASLFKGKTITMVIPSPPGGGTDAAGRLLATSLERYLPGNPNVIVRNIPGAGGITGLNYFVDPSRADGLTVAMASGTQSDPALYRRPQAQFDPVKFAFIGGGIRGGYGLLINTAALDRLLDKSKPPVVMGVAGSYPRTGMLATAWGIDFLGWNARWVMGYPGTNELTIALERGEVDMTTTAVVSLIERLQENGKFKVLTQSGVYENGRFAPRETYGTAPLISDLMTGNISDPLALKAFQFWSSLTMLDKWLALPPNAPKAYVNAYREVFVTATTDPEFQNRVAASGEDFEPMSHTDLESIMTTIGSTPQEAIDYVETMVKRQVKH